MTHKRYAISLFIDWKQKVSAVWVIINNHKCLRITMFLEQLHIIQVLDIISYRYWMKHDFDTNWNEYHIYAVMVISHTFTWYLDYSHLVCGCTILAYHLSNMINKSPFIIIICWILLKYNYLLYWEIFQHKVQKYFLRTIILSVSNIFEILLLLTKSYES